jgi:uncharacterized short protein YbdD (DUF466 family)
MKVRKDDIHNLVEHLPESEPDEEPSTEEELHQLNSDTGYVTGEETKREFGLQADLP